VEFEVEVELSPGFLVVSWLGAAVGACVGVRVIRRLVAVGAVERVGTTEG